MIAVHATDDGPALEGDVELTFELPPDGDKVRVHASMFLERWLPKLPPASAIVLAMCNDHGAALRRPAATPEGVPVHYGIGSVYAWQDGWPDAEPGAGQDAGQDTGPGAGQGAGQDPDRGGRIRLHADAWHILRP